MLVNLSNDWFAPTEREILNQHVKDNEAKILRSRSGRLYRRRDNPHKFSEDMLEFLPKGSVIVDEKIKVEKKVETLRDHDDLRAAGDIVEDRMAKARAAKEAKREASNG